MTAIVPVIILVVDDNDMVLDMICHALEDGGYDVLRCQNAKDALRSLAERIGELGGLLTDVNLGEGQPTGWEVARHARELNPDLPVVYMTGDSAAEWASQGVPHSVLLQKPFASADLVVSLAGLRKFD